jgi:hypothetical protein
MEILVENVMRLTPKGQRVSIGLESNGGKSNFHNRYYRSSIASLESIARVGTRFIAKNASRISGKVDRGSHASADRNRIAQTISGGVSVSRMRSAWVD